MSIVEMLLHENTMNKLCLKKTETRLRGYKTFFHAQLNWARISTAHKN